MRKTPYLFESKRFIIESAKLWGNEIQPHPKAYRKKNGKLWYIDIHSLDELLSLIDGDDGIIVEKHPENGQLRIVLYNDWIES